MTEAQQETKLAKVRLHWGIFIPDLIFAFVFLVTTAPFLFMMHVWANALNQITPQFNQAPVPGRHLFWLAVITPDCVIIPAVFLIAWIAYLKCEVTLTNRRLVFRTGFLSRHSGELPLENIESIIISESFLGRLVGYGSVLVTTVGARSFNLAFIGEPQNFHSILQEAVLTAKNPARSILKQPESAPGQDNDSRYKPK